MDGNEDKTWVTTTIQPGWSAKNGKKHLWPCQFFVTTTINAEAKWRWIAAAPKKIPQITKIDQVTIHLPASWRHTSCSSSISLSSPHSSKRKTTHDVLLTPRYHQLLALPCFFIRQTWNRFWNVSSGTLCSGGPPTPCSMVAVKLVVFKCVFPLTASFRARIFLVSWVRLSYSWAHHSKREQRILSVLPYCTSLVPYSIIVSFLQQHAHRLHHQHHRLHHHHHHHHHHHRHIPSDGQLSPVARSGGPFNWPFVATANWLKSLKDCISTIIIIIFFFE